MSFLEWLEYGTLGEWVAASLVGYPIMLSMHAVGLAIVVGVLFVVDLRIIGCFKSLELVPMRQLIKLAWAGFLVNLTSGIALFMAQATFFFFHPAFIIKIISILLAIVNAAFLQQALRQHAEDWDQGGAISQSTKLLAISSLALWSIAMVAGRMIAYI